VVTMADLDLDVIRHWDGTVVIDDADEFADHQVAYAYPAGVVGAAEAACAAVAAAARSPAGALRGVAGQWARERRGAGPASPAGVVGAAEAACAAVAAAARSHAGAFGGVAGQWLAECRGRCAASHT